MRHVLRWAQAVYDLAWDALGVPVGAYRAILFYATLCSVDVFRMIIDWDLPRVILMLISIPVVAALWYAVPWPRIGCMTDNADQRAGRYAAINLRATDNERGLVERLIIIVAVSGAFYLAFNDVWSMTAYPLAMMGMAVNECLRVRERDADRFKARGPAPAYGGA